MRALLISLCCLGLGCPKVRDLEPEPIVEPDNPVVVGADVSAMIGPAGGSLALNDLTVTIPPGALDTMTEVRAIAETGTIPEGFTAFTPVVRFEPEELQFAAPIRISFPFEGNSSIATLFWTRDGGDEFAALETTVEEDLAIGETNRLGKAFVGTACQGESCCRRAAGALDVLLLVDNSGSMAQEQVALATQLPRVVRALATGDADGDGIQDFPAVSSLQIGSVSPDMGSGGFLVPTCDDATFGDDGVLQTAGNPALSGCDATYPSVQRFDGTSAADRFSSDVACVATMGTDGCGFEQQLEAMLKAVTPSTDATLFHRSTTGHADGANAGLVRENAVLALISLTDEDDCSALDPDLFNPSSPLYGGDLNLRCFQYPEAVHPVDRYVEGLLSIKEDPSQLVYASIAGVPPAMDGASYDAILEAPEMQERVDPGMPTRLAPACSVPGVGVAFPARRMVQTAAALEARGASATVGSVCTDDYTAVVTRILAKIAASVSGTCG
ncbi:MAG: hypothetical protein AAGE52_30935 [Myxococcota bacterium]